MKGKWITVVLSLALAAGLFCVLPAERALAACANNATTQFRSITTGDWNNTSTWECSDDGATWQSATVTPVSSHGVITIRNAHVVTVTVDLTVDQVTVDAGGQVVVNSSVTFSTNNVVGVELLINGTFVHGGTVPDPMSGQGAIGSGGVYIHNTTSSAARMIDFFNRGSVASDSTFIYRGSSSLTPAISVSGKTYGNLSFESTSSTWSSANFSGSTATTIQGNLTIGNNVTINNSSFVGFNVSGNWTNNGSYDAGTGTVTFNRTAGDQTISGSTATAFNNLTVAGLGSSAASNSVVVLPSANSPTAAGTVTNNGTFKQTRDVSSNTEFLRIDNGSGTDKYRGIAVQTSSNLGSTTVSVSGNQPPCWAWGNTQATVKRCFEITPANAASPQVTFYYQFNELNGLTPANLFVWRDAGGGVWTKIVPDTRSACTSGIACSVTVNSLSLSAGANRYVLSSANPTAITLAEFYAQQVNDHVRVTWQTASELNNRGFNLYRGASPAGWDRQLNTALIPSQGQGSPSGFTYTWEDRADLAPGTTYYYWLQDVDLSGAMTMHGPVSVDFTVPTAVTLSGVSASPGLDTLRYSTHAAGAAALPWLWVVAAATGAALGVRRMRR